MKKNIQANFKKKRFGYDQYWKMYFTLFKNKAYEDRYITVIKSRSYDLAKQILENRIKEEDCEIKIKDIQGAMFHKDYQNKNGETLNIKDWQNIRDCSFPNENDHLFKYHFRNITPQEIQVRNQEKIKNLA